VLQAFPIIFIEKHGFTTVQSSLVFIGVAIGTTIGALINWRMTINYPQLIQKWKGFPPPEERLLGSMLGCPLVVIGIFWLGWTGHYPSVPWYVPALSTVCLGIGVCLIFVSFLVCSVTPCVVAIITIYYRATLWIHILCIALQHLQPIPSSDPLSLLRSRSLRCRCLLGYVIPFALLLVFLTIHLVGR